MRPAQDSEPSLKASTLPLALSRPPQNPGHLARVQAQGHLVGSGLRSSRRSLEEHNKGDEEDSLSLPSSKVFSASRFKEQTSALSFAPSPTKRQQVASPVMGAQVRDGIPEGSLSLMCVSDISHGTEIPR